MIRFIAEHGEGAQLMHIENIHRCYDLKPMPHLAPTLASRKRVVAPPVEWPLPITTSIPRCC